MDPASALLLAAAGVTAGAMNAAAGGGSFVSIPALVATGVPAVAANASSTVALLPGTIASAWAWREDYRSFEGVRLGTMIAISLVGGLAGAVLLLATSERAFDALLPWLLLTGTLAFAFGARLGQALRKRVSIGPGTVIGAQVVLSVYAGYFGGGVGIMMMAAWRPARRRRHQGDERGADAAGQRGRTRWRCCSSPSRGRSAGRRRRCCWSRR
jgi:uncharacterized membrane protein YfcA